jgi:hypothetical protein
MFIISIRFYNTALNLFKFYSIAVKSKDCSHVRPIFNNVSNFIIHLNFP